MRFKTIEIENFLILESGTFSFENRGLVLVNGENRDVAQFDSNGSGKTAAIVDSLLWALWGKTSKSIGADDIIRNKNLACAVTLDLEDESTGHQYTIQRYRNHDRYKNALHLYTDQQNITGASVADTQERIDELLGIDFDTFVNSIMFAQRSVKRFSAMTDREQKQALEAILSLEWLTEAYKRTGSELDSVQRKLDDAQHQLSIQHAALEDKNNQLEILIENENTFETTKQQRIAFLQARQTDLHKRVKILEKDLCDHTDTLKYLRQELKTLAPPPRSSQTTLDTDLQDLIRRTATTNEQLRQIKTRRTKTIALAGKCAECGQAIDAAYKTAYLAQLDTAEAALLAQLRQIDDQTQRQRIACNAAAKAARDQENTFRQKSIELTGRIRQLEHEHVQSNKNKIEIDKIERQLGEFDKQIADCKAETNRFTALADQTEDEIQTIKTTLRKETKRAKKLSRAKQYLKFWREGFSARGIRSLVLDSVVEFINRQITVYSDILTGGAIDIELSTTTTLKSGDIKDSLNITAKNQSGAEQYAANSEGERRRIDLCVAFALGDLIATRAQKAFNILVLDEVFTHLDTNGVDMVMLLLQQVAKEKESIFVITHHDDLKTRFANIMTIVREHGKATIIQ